MSYYPPMQSIQAFHDKIQVGFCSHFEIRIMSCRSRDRCFITLMQSCVNWLCCVLLFWREDPLRHVDDDNDNSIFFIYAHYTSNLP